MPPVGVYKMMEVTPKETKQHIHKVKLQGLLNLIGKKNDEKPKRQQK
jgi:hypothetical protein